MEGNVQRMAQKGRQSYICECHRREGVVGLEHRGSARKSVYIKQS